MEIEELQRTYAIHNLVNPKHNTRREEAKHVLEEAGEVLEAVTDVWLGHTQGMGRYSERVGEEIADVIITACVLANRCGINVENAITTKTETNFREGRLREREP